MKQTEATTTSTGEVHTFPPPLVTETLQYRLITGNISKLGGQRGSLTRCAQKFGTFQSKWTSSQADAEAIETSKKELSQELELYRLESTKLILLQQNLQAQVECNQKAEAEQAARIEELSRDVQESQSQANRWQETRKCYLDYESLAKLANENHSQPSRKLKEQIAEVQKEIEQFQEQEGAIDKTLKVRESQFQLLVQYMLDLKRSLAEGDDEAATSKGTHDKKDDKEEGAIKENKSTPMQVDEDDGLYGDL